LVVKKGLEELLLDGSGHAHVGVGDGDQEALFIGLPVCSLTSPQRQGAAFSHCVQRVSDELAEHLTNLAFEAADAPQRL
jgi:hypothetical protein